MLIKRKISSIGFYKTFKRLRDSKQIKDYKILTEAGNHVHCLVTMDSHRLEIDLNVDVIYGAYIKHPDRRVMVMLNDQAEFGNSMFLKNIWVEMDLKE